jgi:hypothetical protein
MIFPASTPPEKVISLARLRLYKLKNPRVVLFLLDALETALFPMVGRIGGLIIFVKKYLEK